MLLPIFITKNSKIFIYRRCTLPPPTRYFSDVEMERHLLEACQKRKGKWLSAKCTMNDMKELEIIHKIVNLWWTNVSKTLKSSRNDMKKMTYLRDKTRALCCHHERCIQIVLLSIISIFNPCIKANRFQHYIKSCYSKHFHILNLILKKCLY